MTDWYYAADGVQCGPVTAEYLRRLLVEKRIEREALVWNASMPEWLPAASVPELAGESTPLFAVGIPKFVVMMLCTFSGYQIYWIYKQWQAIRARTGEDLIPLARGIFSIFFFHLLVQEVNAAAAAQRIERRLPVGALTALFVLLMFSANLPDPVWLISLLVIVPGCIVQHLANEVNQNAAPLANRNTRIRGWNWLAVTLGSLFFVLVIVGTFMPAG